MDLRIAKFGACATLLILVFLSWSRIFAFPASIWEQDEAYFGCGVERFDPTANHPHPPWFPLWIGLGKLAHLFINEPALALQMVSMLSTIAIFFPLVALWSRWLSRRQATLAAMLCLMSPGYWFLSGRAFSEPMATMLLISAACLWMTTRPSAARLLGGSVVGSLCVLVRPHFILPIATLAAWRLTSQKSKKERLFITLPFLGIFFIGLGIVLISAGGLSNLIEALTTHASYHFGGLEKASVSFGELGLSRALISPIAGFGWIALGSLGAFKLWRKPGRDSGFRLFVLTVICPLLGTVFFLAYPGHPRYFLPILAITSGLVVRGSFAILGKSAVPVLIVVVVIMTTAGAVNLPEYRTQDSPPVRALDFAVSEARRLGAVIVADRTLVAFIEYQRTVHGLQSTVLYDYQLTSGETVPPPAWATVALLVNGEDSLLVNAKQERTFTCRQPWLRRLSQGRFLDLTVATGAQLEPSGPARIGTIRHGGD